MKWRQEVLVRSVYRYQSNQMLWVGFKLVGVRAENAMWCETEIGKDTGKSINGNYVTGWTIQIEKREKREREMREEAIGSTPQQGGLRCAPMVWNSSRMVGGSSSSSTENEKNYRQINVMSYQNNTMPIQRVEWFFFVASTLSLWCSWFLYFL